MIESVFDISRTTITDWLQALGAIGVFYTLFLQYKANQVQSKQLRINLIPKFVLTLREKENLFNPDEFFDVITTIKLERNIAYQVSIKIIDAGNTGILDQIISQSMVDGDSFELVAECEKVQQPPYYCFELIFQDVLGNFYKQRIGMYANRFTNSAPELVNN